MSRSIAMSIFSFLCILAISGCCCVPHARPDGAAPLAAAASSGVRIVGIRVRHPVVLHMEHPPNSPVDEFVVLLAQIASAEGLAPEGLPPTTIGISDGEVEVDEGMFGYAAGKRPRLRTTWVDAISDSTIMIVEARADVHRVYLLDGGPLTLHTDHEMWRLREAWSYIEARRINEEIVLSGPFKWATADQSIKDFVEGVLRIAAGEQFPVVQAP